MPCLHPACPVQAALGSPELPACASLLAGTAPYAEPVRHFSANTSAKFSGGGRCFAELRPFPRDEQISPGIIKALPALFYCYFGYRSNNEKAQMKELILIQAKRFRKVEIPEGVLFYGLEKGPQF